MREKIFFCYNHFQSDYLIQNGIMPLGVGKGGKGDIFIKFARNEKFEEVFQRWLDRCNQIN